MGPTFLSRQYVILDSAQLYIKLTHVCFQLMSGYHEQNIKFDNKLFVVLLEVLLGKLAFVKTLIFNKLIDVQN